MTDRDDNLYEEFREIYGEYWHYALCRLVPFHMQEEMLRYMVRRIKPGNFLTSVLIHDWDQAMGRADQINLANIQNYRSFMYNCMQQNQQGSPEIVAEWLNGKDKADE